MGKPKVAVLKTTPSTVLEDYRQLMRMADYKEFISPEQESLIKINLSWTKYFPSCSSQPWQLEGLVKTLLEDGFSPQKLFPVENKTVVTDPVKGARNNKWTPVLEKYGLPYLVRLLLRHHTFLEMVLELPWLMDTWRDRI